MKNFKTIDPQDLTTREVHKILLNAVTPRPIALASTIDKNGNVNLSPFSYFNVFSAAPPILVFSPANRVTDNSRKDTLENILETKEVVINLVDFSLVEPTSLSSVYYERGIDEFLKSGLTKITSKKVLPPRVSESPISFECKVNEVISLGNNGGAGNLIVSEIVMMHINKQLLTLNGDIDPLKLNLVARMGGNYYLNVKSENLFEIQKPIGVNAIGVDKLPNHANKSDILTKNDLARLANIETLPKKAQIKKFIESYEIEKITSLANENEKVILNHKKVKEYLDKNDLESAVLTLFSI
jgi:flavin reductase (DIM6/NTAB) family NADH-FMN oxidoreductase RutF